MGRYFLSVIFMRRSFTLIELLIVIIIVGVLAAFAMPQYIKTQNKVLQKEAISNLKLIAAGERIYKMENGAYVNCADATTCNSLLKLALNTVTWTYWVDGASAAACTVHASSVKVNCAYTLGSADFDGTLGYSSTTCS